MGSLRVGWMRRLSRIVEGVRWCVVVVTSAVVGLGACAGAGQAATFTVSNTGPGSLNQAILDANANPGPDTIMFSIGAGPQTISYPAGNYLPPVNGQVVIDGTTQPGYSGVPLIRLQGTTSPFSQTMGLD